MLIRIDPGSDQPIYLQIAKSIETQIEGGALRAGERLPSARSLSASLGINMHTVLKAYLNDTERARVLRSDGTYHAPAPSTEPVDAQQLLVGVSR